MEKQEVCPAKKSICGGSDSALREPHFANLLLTSRILRREARLSLISHDPNFGALHRITPINVQARLSTTLSPHHPLQPTPWASLHPLIHIVIRSYIRFALHIALSQFSLSFINPAFSSSTSPLPHTPLQEQQDLPPSHYPPHSTSIGFLALPPHSTSVPPRLYPLTPHRFLPAHPLHLCPSAVPPRCLRVSAACLTPPSGPSPRNQYPFH